MAVNVLFLCLLALAVMCLLAARCLRWRSGLPSGALSYADSGRNNMRVLVSERYGLRGKPDYLLKDRAGGIIPVELKSGLMPRNGQPHRSHTLQLAVYFLLVEEALNEDVSYGLVQYRDGALWIRNTDGLRAELLQVLAAMRAALREGDTPRSHAKASRCRACSVAGSCAERLV